MKTRKHFAFMLLLGLLLLAAPGPGYAQTVDFVESDNLTLGPPAQILNYFGMRDWRGCRQACAGDSRCKAYTFVKPSGYRAGDPPVCYLMSSLGSQVRHSCCITGLKRATIGGGGSCDIAGRWTHKTNNLPEAGWTFTRKPDGTYDARESGLGYSYGIATVNRQTITLPFRSENGRDSGTFVWTLNESCSAGEGTVKGTGWSFPTKIWRSGSGGRGGGRN